MDNRWSFAIQHGWGSFVGILRLSLSQPAFGLSLLGHRLTYFLTRRFSRPLLTPEKFSIDTPDALIAYWSMFVEHELYDPAWVNAVRAQEKPLVVDVGANAAVFTHYVHCLNPNGEFVAFEPLPPMAERIRALKERTQMNLTLHQKAVSKTCGEALFESPHGYDGTSRLAIEGQAGANTFRVETTTLDTSLPNRRITVMKVDVEGFECDVIEGGRQCLASTDYLIMEAEDPVHLANITQLLGDGWSRKKVGATDYLFSRESK